MILNHGSDSEVAPNKLLQVLWIVLNDDRHAVCEIGCQLDLKTTRSDCTEHFHLIIKCGRLIRFQSASDHCESIDAIQHAHVANWPKAASALSCVGELLERINVRKLFC